MVKDLIMLFCSGSQKVDPDKLIEITNNKNLCGMIKYDKLYICYQCYQDNEYSLNPPEYNIGQIQT